MYSAISNRLTTQSKPDLRYYKTFLFFCHVRVSACALNDGRERVYMYVSARVYAERYGEAAGLYGAVRDVRQPRGSGAPRPDADGVRQLQRVPAAPGAPRAGAGPVASPGPLHAGKPRPVGVRPPSTSFLPLPTA